MFNNLYSITDSENIFKMLYEAIKGYVKFTFYVELHYYSKLLVEILSLHLKKLYIISVAGI